MTGVPGGNVGSLRDMPLLFQARALHRRWQARRRPPFPVVTLMDGARAGFWRCPGVMGDLAAEVDAISAWGARAVLTLVETQEIGEDALAALRARVEASGMAWRHLPLRDMTAPDRIWSGAFDRLAPDLDGWLAGKGRILVHCRAGAGRAGTLAAYLLIRSGVPRSAAIARVRAARPGAIETSAQECWLLKG